MQVNDQISRRDGIFGTFKQISASADIHSFVKCLKGSTGETYDDTANRPKPREFRRELENGDTVEVCNSPNNVSALTSVGMSKSAL